VSVLSEGDPGGERSGYVLEWSQAGEYDKINIRNNFNSYLLKINYLIQTNTKYLT
jgi:hypothetical protein